MTQSCSRLACILLSLIILSIAAGAQERKSLEGLPGFRLTVTLNPKAETVVSQDEVERLIISNLIQSRIPLLTLKEWQAVPSNPTLIIAIRGMENSYYLRVEIYQSVWMKNRKITEIMATTWSRESVGQLNNGILRDNIEKFIEELIADYGAANNLDPLLVPPKLPRKKPKE